MMRKSWTKWILIAVIALALIVGVPIIINECYKTNSGYMTIWGAADALSYYGTILGSLVAVATVVVTILFTYKQIQRDSYVFFYAFFNLRNLLYLILPNPHGRPPVLRHYVQSSPHLFDRSSIAKQNLSHRANVICDGSPSRIRMVRRISLGITTRPRSSMRRTIPVAFIYKFPPVKADFSLVVSAVAGVLCTGSFFHNTADFAL